VRDPQIATQQLATQSSLLGTGARSGIGRVYRAKQAFGTIRQRPDDPDPDWRPAHQDGTPWHEQTRDGWLELVGPDRHLMRGIWTMTRRYVKASLVEDD
jgi:hypothetical protein